MGAAAWMDAPARIKKEDQRRGGTKEIAPQNEGGGRGCTDCFKGEIRRKRPERGRAGWRGRGGKREKQTTFPLHPEAWRLR